VPCLYLLENGFLKSRELPIDTLAQDDEGYYLVNANLRVPLKAIVETHYSEEDGLILQLEELDLERRNLCR
jgi:hypothetical protein